VGQINNPVTFHGKPIESEKFLNRMVEALGITIDRRSKGRLRKIESQTIEKIGCVTIYLKVV
jgi:hypothetical protein